MPSMKVLQQDITAVDRVGSEITAVESLGYRSWERYMIPLHPEFAITTIHCRAPIDDVSSAIASLNPTLV